MSDVVVVIGAGSIGQAIARRVSAGKQVVLADLHRENADAAAEVMRNAGFDVTTATVDVPSRESVHGRHDDGNLLTQLRTCRGRQIRNTGLTRLIESFQLFA